jgi:hypothetical protein
MSDEPYPRLAYLLQAYFHQNWAAEYRREGQTPTYRRVVADVRDREPPGVVAGIIADLDDVIARDLAEEDLRALSRRLGSQFSPPGAGTTYAAWLRDIRAVLAAPRGSAPAL